MYKESSDPISGTEPAGDPIDDTAANTADPIEQARELLRLTRAGKTITGAGVERDAAALIAASQLATAYHVQRIADALEALIDTRHIAGLADDLAAIIAAQCKREE